LHCMQPLFLCLQQASVQTISGNVSQKSLVAIKIICVTG
jgi:hypothetical protein